LTVGRHDASHAGMSEIHELVRHHGVERAKALARSKHDRRLVEIAAGMLTEETHR
jgi:hypothetical protein